MYRIEQPGWFGVYLRFTFIMPGPRRKRKSRKASRSEEVDPTLTTEASGKSEEQVRIDGWVALADTALKPPTDPDQGPKDE